MDEIKIREQLRQAQLQEFLTENTPRAVKPRMSFWILIGAFCLAPLIFVFLLGMDLYRYGHVLQLKDKGTRVTAFAIAKHPVELRGKNPHTDYYVKYAFLVDPKIYVGDGLVLKNDYEQVQKKSPLIVFYDPLNPDKSCMEYEISYRALDMSAKLKIFPIVIVLMLVPMLALAFFVFYKPEAELLRYGRLTPAWITSTRIGPKGGRFFDYVFLDANNSLIEAKGRPAPARKAKIVEINTIATAIYDPKDAKKTKLYPLGFVQLK